jgi:hypothetical protein
MKTKPSINHILNTRETAMLRVSETNTKFGLIKRIAYVQGSNRNEAHFIYGRVYEEGERSADATRITIKRIPKWRAASVYQR